MYFIVEEWSKPSAGAHIYINSVRKWKSLRNFNQDSIIEKAQEWDEIINAIGGYFKHADSYLFELPERNLIWSRPETINLFEKTT